MSLTIRFRKSCICQGHCGAVVFCDLFHQGDTVPDPAWPTGCNVTRDENGDFRITHQSVRGYVIDRIPSEAVKVLSGEPLAPRGKGLRGTILEALPNEIVRALRRDPADTGRHLEMLHRLWATVCHQTVTN
jgi:hypothetical protein